MSIHRRLVIPALAALLAGCEHDMLIANPSAVVDSLEAASNRGPGTSGDLETLWGSNWKGVEVFAAGTPSAQIQQRVNGAAAREFERLVERDTNGTVLVFSFIHGAIQTVFVPHSRAVFSRETIGRPFGSYSTFSIDSAGRFVMHSRRVTTR